MYSAKNRFEKLAEKYVQFLLKSTTKHRILIVSLLTQPTNLRDMVHKKKMYQGNPRAKSMVLKNR